MSLQQWLDNSWIRSITPSAQEIDGLLGIADREIADASLEGISADGRFDHAYSAVRALCEAALHASAYTVPKDSRKHERTIESLKLTLDAEWVEDADYFDQCRRRRHQSLYERSDVTQPADADELLARAKRLLTAVREWLQREHAHLIRAS